MKPNSMLSTVIITIMLQDHLQDVPFQTFSNDKNKSATLIISEL